MTRARELGTTELALYTFDPLSRRQSVRFNGSATDSMGYTYEPDDDLDVLTNILNGSTTVTLDQGHNASHQITSILANDSFYLAKPVAASSTAYALNALNEYGSIGGIATAHDLNGNLTAWTLPGGISAESYTYDAENRLRTFAVTGAGAGSGSYDYDSLGRRITKTVGSTTTTYLLDGDEEIAEYVGGTLQRRYVTGPAIDERIAHIESSSTSPPAASFTFYHTNHQGSVIAMTNGAGTVVQNMSYDEFGQLKAGSSATGEPFRFVGRRLDAETGLYYYRARYYSSQLGRFLSTDPMGYKDDLNLYTYVGNDALNSTDPTGREIRLESHKAYFGYNHAKITIIPNHQAKYKDDPRFANNILPDGRHFATIGAAAGGPFLNTLVSSVNGANDVAYTKNGKNETSELLTPPGGDEDAAIENLFATDSRYGDNLDYDGRQEHWSEGFNSNGYANGLLRATGFVGFHQPPHATGWDNFVTFPPPKKHVEITIGTPEELFVVPKLQNNFFY